MLAFVLYKKKFQNFRHCFVIARKCCVFTYAFFLLDTPTCSLLICSRSTWRIAFYNTQRYFYRQLDWMLVRQLLLDWVYIDINSANHKWMNYTDEIEKYICYISCYMAEILLIWPKNPKQLMDSEWFNFFFVQLSTGVPWWSLTYSTDLHMTSHLHRRVGYIYNSRCQHYWDSLHPRDIGRSHLGIHLHLQYHNMENFNFWNFLKHEKGIKMRKLVQQIDL